MNVKQRIPICGSGATIQFFKAYFSKKSLLRPNFANLHVMGSYPHGLDYSLGAPDLNPHTPDCNMGGANYTI
jgi:hypothetical protein